MSKTGWFALVVALALCTAVPAAAQIQNPGFEAGNFTGWNTAGTGATFAVTTGNQQAGTYCAELTGTDGSLVDLTQEVPCLPNTRYSVTLYYKNSGAVAAWDSHIEELDAGHVYAGVTDGLSTLPGSVPAWTMVQKTFTTGPNTHYLLWYNRANIPTGIKLYLDSYSIVELGPGGGATNGGFELGSFAGWSTSGTGATFAVTTGSQHGGTYCAEITGTTGSLITLDQIVSDVLPSTSYTASVWVKKTGNWNGNPAPAVDNKILEYDINGNYIPGTPIHSLSIPGSGTCDWSKFVTTFTTNPATRKLHWINNANVRPAGDKLFLDDYVVGVTPPPPTCVGTPCNGGFETGEIDFWNMSGSGVSVAVTDGGAGGTNSGNYCLQLTGTTGALFHLHQDFTGLTEGETYEASAYFRTSAPIGAIGIVLVEHNPGGDISHSLITGGAENRPGWSKVSTSFTVQPGTTGFTWHNDENVPLGVNLFIDDCKVRVLPQCVGVPCNGTFETGETDFWTSWGSAAIASTTTVNPHTGSYAAHITGTSPNEALVAPLCGFDQDVTIQPSKSYIATMWYRSEGNWVNDAWDSKIIVKDTDGDALGTYGFGIGATLTPGWTKATVVFHAPAGAASITWNNQFDIHSTDHMYLDDLQLAEITSYTAFGTVGQLRNAGPAVPATLDGVVTRAIDDAYFFVESSDRSSGIFVESKDFPIGSVPAPGDVVHLRGWIESSQYEDIVLAKRLFNGMQVFRTDATPTPGTPAHVTPLKPLGTLLRPILTNTGAPLDGLFVKLGGMVTTVKTDGTFQINEGSGNDITVGYYSMYEPFVGDLLAITGLVVTDNGVRWIYTTSDDSWQTYP